MHVKKAANEFGIYFIVSSMKQDEIAGFTSHFTKGLVKENLELLSIDNDEEIKSTSEDRHRKYEMCFLMNPNVKYHKTSSDEDLLYIVIQRLKSPILKKLKILGEGEMYLDFNLCKSSSPLGEIEEWINKTNNPF
jgi:hypothetical protein